MTAYHRYTRKLAAKNKWVVGAINYPRRLIRLFMSYLACLCNFAINPCFAACLSRKSPLLVSKHIERAAYFSVGNPLIPRDTIRAVFVPPRRTTPSPFSHSPACPAAYNERESCLKTHVSSVIILAHTELRYYVKWAPHIFVRKENNYIAIR